MIHRYVLVNPEGVEQDYEYQHADNAVVDARRLGFAVVERQYEFVDSELIWTPNGEKVWA